MNYVDFEKEFVSTSLNIKTRWNGHILGLKYNLSPLLMKLPRLRVVYVGRKQEEIHSFLDGGQKPTTVLGSSNLIEYVTCCFEDDDIDPEVAHCLKWLLAFEKYLSLVAKKMGFKFRGRLFTKGEKDDLYYINLSCKETEFYDNENKLVKDMSNFETSKISTLRALVEIPSLWRSYGSVSADGTDSQSLTYKLQTHQIRFLPKFWKRGISVLEECRKLTILGPHGLTKTIQIVDRSGGTIPPPPPPPPGCGPRLVGKGGVPPPPPPPPPPPKGGNKPKVPKGGVPLPFLGDIQKGAYQLKSVDESDRPERPLDDGEFKIDLKTLLEQRGKLKSVGFEHLGEPVCPPPKPPTPKGSNRKQT